MENNIWWCKEDIEWGNIGADVVSRPTELQALNNISQQSKYIRLVGFDINTIRLTNTERKIYVLELEVSSERFDAKNHPLVKIKDSPVRRISKISGYSEPFIMRQLTSVTRKMYLSELFDVNIFEEKEQPHERLRRRKLTQRYNYYKSKGAL